MQKGTHVGVMYFNQNFSKAMQSRIEDFINTEETDILASEIKVNLDMSSMYCTKNFNIDKVTNI